LKNIEIILKMQKFHYIHLKFESR